MSRTVVIDANVISELHRNNTRVAEALRRLTRSGARVYVTAHTLNELTGGVRGVLVTGVGKQKGVAESIGPNSAQMARANALILDHLGIELTPSTRLAGRLPVHERNETHQNIQKKDLIMVAEAKALNAELWTMEKNDKLSRRAPEYGVALAPESRLPVTSGRGDYRNGLKFVGLENVYISANGTVTIHPRRGSAPGSPAVPPTSPPGARGAGRAVRAAARGGAIELAFQGANFILHGINDAAEGRKLREAWAIEQKKIEVRLAANRRLGALVLFQFTQRRRVGPETDSILQPLLEFRDILVGYGVDDVEALQDASRDSRVYKAAHGNVAYDVITQKKWFPPQQQQSTAEVARRLGAYALATFAPGCARLQRVFYGAMGFDDDGEIDLKVPRGLTPQFYLLSMPTELNWTTRNGPQKRLLDIQWVEPNNYIFLSRIQSLDLDPWIGVGRTRAAMVYPADAATRALFGDRGHTEDKDGLLRRIDSRLITVHWVQPKNIDVLDDFRELDTDTRPSRKVRSAPHEPPRHFTPEIGGFNMEEEANRPKVLRD